jgi:hypothetical protein
MVEVTLDTAMDHAACKAAILAALVGGDTMPPIH